MMYLGSNAVGLATSIPEFADKGKVEFGSYTPSTDEEVMTTFIPHSLGVIPNFIVYFTVGFILSEEYTENYAICGALYPRDVTPGFTGYICCNNSVSGTTNIGTVRASSDIDTVQTNTTFRMFGSTGIKLKANTTYYYVIGRYDGEVTSNA